MGTLELEEFVERALFLDRDDPVAAWGELRDVPGRADRAPGAGPRGPHRGTGTDLRLNVEGRTWVNSDGKRNMPSGEVFTGPLESSAEGVVRFTIPTAPRGVVVEDVTLEFREGRVVNAKAERGDAYLQATLETDPGARFLGELGIGTNFGIDRPIGAILFDEKIGGTVHLALGRSYPETGGTNESVVHWDLICDLREGGALAPTASRCSSTGSSAPGAQPPFRAACAARRSGHAPMAVVVALALAGCGGAAAPRRRDAAQGRRLPAVRADRHRADAGARPRSRVGLGVHGVLRRGRGADHGPQLRLPRRARAGAAPPPARARSRRSRWSTSPTWASTAGTSTACPRPV